MNEIELTRTLYVLRKLLAWSEAYKKGWVYSLWFKLKTFNEDVVLPSTRYNCGVCYYLDKNKCGKLPFWLIDKITQTWSIGWPVKPFAEVYASREYANTTFKEKWGNHPYAENRRQYIRDCIRELEEFSRYKIGYDDKHFCCKCKGRNKVGTITTESGYIAECTTTCSACSHEDYWAYGFYQR